MGFTKEKEVITEEKSIMNKQLIFHHKVYYILFLFSFLSCSKYTGIYTDGYGVTSIIIESGGKVTTGGDCIGDWEETDNGIRIFNMLNQNSSTSSCYALEGNYEYGKNTYGDDALFGEIVWIKK